MMQVEQEQQVERLELIQGELKFIIDLSDFVKRISKKENATPAELSAMASIGNVLVDYVTRWGSEIVLKRDEFKFIVGLSDFVKRISKKENATPAELSALANIADVLVSYVLNI